MSCADCTSPEAGQVLDTWIRFQPASDLSCDPHSSAVGAVSPQQCYVVCPPLTCLPRILSASLSVDSTCGQFDLRPYLLITITFAEPMGHAKLKRAALLSEKCACCRLLLLETPLHRAQIRRSAMIMTQTGYVGHLC